MTAITSNAFYVDSEPETGENGERIVYRDRPAPPSEPAAAAPPGPGHDDDYIFVAKAGTIRIRSMSKGKNPPPFKMMKAEAAKNYSAMTLLVLETKAGKDWPAIEAVLEQMDEDEFKAFSEGYAEHSGMSTGESRAS
jgi:hypothetical protein